MTRQKSHKEASLKDKKHSVRANLMQEKMEGSRGPE